MDDEWCVYGLIFETGAVYVGMTFDPGARLHLHRDTLSAVTFRKIPWAMADLVGVPFRMVVLSWHPTEEAAALVECATIAAVQARGLDLRNSTVQAALARTNAAWAKRAHRCVALWRTDWRKAGGKSHHGWRAHMERAGVVR